MKTLALTALLALAACGGGGSSPSVIPAASAQSAPVQSYPPQETQHNRNLWFSHAELWNGLYVTGSSDASTYEWESVYTVTITGLQLNDTVHCTAQAEVTNNLGYDVQVDAAIAVGNWSGSAWPTFLNGVVAGTDVPTEIHHGRFEVSTYDETPREGTVTYSLVLQSASTAAKTGDAIAVNQGYGYLQCNVTHGQS